MTRSDVLFVVSSLIRALFADVRQKNGGNIKQVLVLTHNAYFHKEVSFDSKSKQHKRKDETFWTVRKSGMSSRIESHSTNPITSTYELLWREVTRPDQTGLSLPNTLRRILEHYFKITGSVDFEKISAKFDGERKLICRSLFSWINEGSHSAFDDPHYSPDQAMADSYLKVFKDIFCHTGNGEHYRMMMGEEQTD